MNQSIRNILIILFSFGIYFVLDAMYFKIVRNWLFETINQFGVSHIIAYTISGIPLYIGTLLIIKKSKFFTYLGLDKSILTGLVFALVCTLPACIGFSFIFDFTFKISLNTILISVVSAAFFEELFFRGFLFGMPFTTTKLGFITSVLFGAVYFGLLHTYQSDDLSETLGIFLITFLGGILFAWVYAEWKYNIWVPIFLHLFMNLFWELFAVSDNALGSLYANIFRLITVSLVIAITLIYKHSLGMKLKITKRNIFIKKTIEL